MSLPHHEWLSIAKSLTVGSTTRVKHRHEARHNLVIGNEADRWWCYCQSCKEGGLEPKPHVRITATAEPTKSRQVSMPYDRVQLLGAPSLLVEKLGGFLASKGMDFAYLPAEIAYSDERKRLLVPVQCNWQLFWHGRDTTGASPQKWLSYSSQCAYAAPTDLRTPHRTAVITEDLFSMYKVHWACLHNDMPVSVLSSLGTRIHDKMLLSLVRGCDTVFVMYDGDKAGSVGCTQQLRRLRGMGLSAKPIHVPDGFDPKDLPIAAITEIIGGALLTP